MPLREPMSLRATDHGVISQECTNKGRALLFDLDYEARSKINDYRMRWMRKTL